MMNLAIKKVCFLVALAACGTMAYAQFPNEKFGKPSKQEWEFVGWGDAVKADAIILSTTMTATYQMTDQVATTNQSDPDMSIDNLADFGKNLIDDSNLLIKYEVNLRTKILKAEGAKHANIDITYFSLNDKKLISFDEIEDLKVKVFTKNEKGKVEKKNINTASFVRERVDDNYMVLHVVVPDVQPGSIVEYTYKITSVRPAYLYDWLFQECIPTVHSKCDIQVPAFLQFNMNVPINKLIRSGVIADRLAYDTNRPDLKKGKSVITNHYTIVGDYIPSEGETIAPFTSMLSKPSLDKLPVPMPVGSSHLKVK